MEKIVIYGAGNTGKSAYFYFKSQNRYDCLFFVDKDKQKQCEMIEGLQVKSPDALRELKGVKIIIASIFWKEIMQEIGENSNLDIAVYNPEIEYSIENEMKEELDSRTIDLGKFLKRQGEITCKELAFMPGGSQVLDYAFLKALAQEYNCKNYLEIGTYIGESINILTDCCEKLYSITAPRQGYPFSVDHLCKEMNFPNYSDRLAYSNKISHFYTDSKFFDFAQIKDKIDLYFIDGDHSYMGIYADTQNVFRVREEDSIVVWHDFRKGFFSYRYETVYAVRNALGSKFNNVYVTNGNYCGVYLPDKYVKDFETHSKVSYKKDAELYTYDMVLKNCQIK